MQTGLKNTSKTTILIDDFLTPEECKQCIDFYLNNPHKHGPMIKHKATMILIGDTAKDICPNPWIPDEMRTMWYKLRDFGRIFDKELQWAQVYHWPEGSHMDLHHDVASRATRFTSVVWLNEDFEFGQLAFKDGTTFTPKTGRAIWYDGIHYWHRVRQVRNGTRWALAAWYKDIECNTNSMKTT